MNIYNQLHLSPKKVGEYFKNNKIVVSISGLDNVGKSTQSKLLSTQYPELFSQPLHINQTDAFPKMNGKELSEWWFNRANASNFVSTMYKAIGQRFQMAKEVDQGVVVLDKGIDFYDMRIKATLLTMGIDDDAIANMINQAKKDNGLVNSMEDLKLIITADNVDHIKEKGLRDDDEYAYYMSKNIELLNAKLNNKNDFVQVKYISNDINAMNETILTCIADKMQSCSQCQHYDTIVNMASDSFGDNLSALILGGSAGKNKFIEDWSDMDLYVILRDREEKQIRDFVNKLDFNFHVGRTFYSEKEINNDIIDNRTRVMLYEVGKGSDKLLYNRDDYQLPKYSIADIVKMDISEKSLAFNGLKSAIYNQSAVEVANRTVSDSSNNKASSNIVKSSILLEKILLRIGEGLIGGGYTDTSTAYYQMVSRYYNQQGEGDQKKLDILGSTDVVDCIKNVKECRQEISDYGSAVLDTASEIGI